MFDVRNRIINACSSRMSFDFYGQFMSGTDKTHLTDFCHYYILLPIFIVLNSSSNSFVQSSPNCPSVKFN